MTIDPEPRRTIEAFAPWREAGVRAVSLREGDFVVEMDVLPPGTDVAPDEPEDVDSEPAAEDESAEAEVAGERGRLRGDAFHHVAISGNGVPGIDKHHIAATQFGSELGVPFLDGRTTADFFRCPPRHVA